MDTWTTPTLIEPDRIAFTFDAPGWKVVGIILLISLSLLIYRQWRSYLRNAYRRKALLQMKELAPGRDGWMTMWILTRQVAIHRFGRERTASLKGLAWLSFLEKTGKNVNLMAHSTAIHQGIYGAELPSEPTARAVLQELIQWIKSHE
ncbi:DUF4381 domain-containing protein [Cryomorphaceae bacterium]|nr:DUF4381 domain-containing protein [Cryomorphaceae bacterium]